MKKMITLILLIMISCLVKGQNLNRAYKYLDREQHEKAAKAFEKNIPKILNKYGDNDTTYFSHLLFLTAYSHHQTGNYAEAEFYYLKSMEIYENINSTKSMAYLNYFDWLVDLYIETNNPDKAEIVFRKVLSLIEENHGKMCGAFITVQKDFGQLLNYRGQHQSAITVFEEALENIEEYLGKTHPDHGYLCNTISLAYLYLQNYKKAEFYGFESLHNTEINKGKCSKDYVDMVGHMFLVCYLNNNIDRSLLLAHEFKDLVTDQNCKHESDDLTLLSSTIFLLRSGHKEKMFEIAMIIETVIEANPHSEGSDFLFLSHLWDFLEYPDKALSSAIKALEEFKKQSELIEDVYCMLLNRLAYQHYQLRIYDKALAYALELIEISENSPYIFIEDQGDYLNTLSVILQEMKLCEHALPHALKSLEIAEKAYGNQHPSYATRLNNIATIMNCLGNTDEAILFYEEAIEILRHSDDWLKYSKTLDNLAEIYFQVGQCDKARQLTHQSRILFIFYSATHLESYAIATLRLGLIYECLNNIENAFEFINEANDYFLTKMVSNFKIISESDKEQIIYKLSPIFNTFNSFSIRNVNEFLNISSNAFDFELLNKLMILNSGVRMRKDILNNGKPEALAKYDEWMLIRASIAEHYRLGKSNESPTTLKLEAEAEKLESELAMLSNTFKEAQSIGSITWRDVQQQLGENEVAIEFSSFPYYYGKRWTDSTFYTANVLRPGDEHPHLIYLCEQRQLDSLLYRPGNTEKAFIDALYRGAKPIETFLPANGQRLYELIWKPIAHLLPEGATVYFAPAGSLHQIAHAAIPVGEDTLLLDKYKLVQLSTTAALLKEDDQNKTLTGEIVLFGGIEYDMSEEELIARSARHEDLSYLQVQRGIPAGLERSAETWSYLPGTLTEVEAIGKLAATQGMEVTSYTGKEALEERFKELSGKNSPTILHIATHGFFSPDPQKEPQRDGFMMIDQEKQMFRASDNPLNRAGLLFAGANLNWQGNTMPIGVDDGILTAWEATNVTLANTQLVALSACETGLGEVRGSEGVFGLQRAFKAAGAEYLLMSLWKVPDHETAEFMTYFYARLFEGSAIPAAFHATQRHMKTQYPAEPYKWAAFVLTR